MKLLGAALVCFVVAGVGLLLPFASARAVTEVCLLLFVFLLLGGLAAVEQGGVNAAKRTSSPARLSDRRLGRVRQAAKYARRLSQRGHYSQD